MAPARPSAPPRAGTPPPGGGADSHGGATALVAVVAVLCLVGLVMVLSASSVQALRHYGTSWLFFQRQVLWVLAGSAVLLLASRVDYRVWRRLAGPLFALSVVLLALVLLPGAGVTVGGSTRWLGTESVRVQPSELAKLGLVLFCAERLSRRGRGAGGGDDGLRPVLVALAVLAVLVLRQPDLGTTLVMVAVVLAMLHAAGTPLPRMAALGAAAVAATFVLGMAAPYRRARMMSFLDPWADPGNTGYQVVQSLVGMGTGRLTGVGVGASRAKWGFLPNAHTDFIFAIVGEELGLVGSLLLLSLFVAFAVLGMRAAVRAPDRFAMLLAVGVTAWVVAQTFINVGAVVGLLPVSGVPLPFVSFGGSSLVILMGAVGVLLNVARNSRRRLPPPPA